MIVTARRLRDENSQLKRKDRKNWLKHAMLCLLLRARFCKVLPVQLFKLKSWMSAASFQETTKVLNEAAINGKIDDLATV
jgi:DNA-directed RNA polymerase subunit beta'